MRNVFFKRGSKYGNRKVSIDGINFDSAVEANRYRSLKLLEKNKHIGYITTQPKFVLQDKFKVNEKSERAIVYIADFRYFDFTLEKIVIEDVKGFKTKEYKIKRKLLLFQIKENQLLLFREITK